MNEFTKEELETIRMLINNTDEKALTSSEKIMLVQSKIQSMIDNYCEHDGSMVCMDGPQNITWQCKKCGEFYR